MLKFKREVTKSNEWKLDHALLLKIKRLIEEDEEHFFSISDGAIEAVLLAAEVVSVGEEISEVTPELFDYAGFEGKIQNYSDEITAWLNQKVTPGLPLPCYDLSLWLSQKTNYDANLSFALTDADKTELKRFAEIAVWYKCKDFGLALLVWKFENHLKEING